MQKLTNTYSYQSHIISFSNDNKLSRMRSSLQKLNSEHKTVFPINEINVPYRRPSWCNIRRVLSF